MNMTFNSKLVLNAFSVSLLPGAESPLGAFPAAAACPDASRCTLTPPGSTEAELGLAPAPLLRQLRQVLLDELEVGECLGQPDAGRVSRPSTSMPSRTLASQRTMT